MTPTPQPKVALITGATGQDVSRAAALNFKADWALATAGELPYKIEPL